MLRFVIRWSKVLVALVLLAPGASWAAESYQVVTEHPRLWLNARRLRLLRRERERQTVRWQQLEQLSGETPALPEEPLVRALEYQVAGSQEAARRARAWAAGRAGQPGAPDAAELRLLAIVFDWCYPVMPEEERRKVAERMVRGVAAMATQPSWTAFASRVMGATVLVDDWEGAEPALTEALEKTWRGTLLPALERGRGPETPAERVALLEFCYAARDNVNLEAWKDAGAYFRQFPAYLLLQYYPAPVEIDGYRFRQPYRPMSVAAEDAARQGELERRADLLAAAYETNSVETQFLQGWLTHDIYRLRTASGAAYEFLWLNPYQPGLSYYSAPLVLHDELGGRLFARSSWDDDATWIGYDGGELQLFADGERSKIGPAERPQPVIFSDLAVVWASGDTTFNVRMGEGGDVYVVGLAAGRTYWVKAGEAEFVPKTAGAGGILQVEAGAGEMTTFELRTTAPPPPPPAPPKRGRRQR
jgi:hypothetical protein